MIRSSSRSLLLVALGLAALGTVVLLLTRSGGQRGLPELVVQRSGAPVVETPESEDTLLPAPEPVRYSQAELARTTVLWPLRVELDLIEAGYLPNADGVPPIHSGANAEISGHVTGTNDEGLRARLEFVAGPNAGRVLSTDATGKFGASDLYPGISVVEVNAPGTLGSRREVRLRAGMETTFNLSYAAPGFARGRVQDREGQPVQGARVTVDGIETATDPEGAFFVGRVAAGVVLVEIEHPDYASYLELVNIASSLVRSGSPDLAFTLHPGATLRVAASPDVGGPGPLTLLLLPGEHSRTSPEMSYRNMRFPYHAINPIEMRPGVTKTIEGLPQEVVQVHAFRAGARARMAVVNLRSKQVTDLSLMLEPAPVLAGRVVANGEPVAGAEVRMEAPNTVRTTLGYLRTGPKYLETAAMPIFPVARQCQRTDDEGRFRFSAWEEESPTRFLEARGPDGKTWAGRLVRAGQHEVELELQEVTLADSELVLSLPDRWQALPIELFVDGTPADPFYLPAGEPLRVESLVGGRWRLKLSWRGKPILEEELDLRDVTDRSASLPPECIEGQDEEAWSRAGREYPGA